MRAPLGTVLVGGKSFDVVLLGELIAGKEGAFEVRPQEPSADDSLYLWVEDADGAVLSAPAKGEAEESGFHFHVTPQVRGKTPSRVVLRLRSGEQDDRAGLPLR